MSQAQPEELTGIKVRRYYQRTLSPGEVVFDEGDPSDQLYVIQAGEVELVRETERKERVVARLGPGDFFGELGLVAGERRTSRAVAVNTTRLIALDRETLEVDVSRGAGDRDPDDPRAGRAAGRGGAPARRARRRRPDAAGGAVAAAARRRGERLGMRVDAKLRAIASAAGLSMLEVHRALHQLFDRKLATLEDDVLHIPDCEALNGFLDPQ